MPTVERTFTVTAEPTVVLEYLKDFANAEEWDLGTQRCTGQEDGPLGVGSTWTNTSKVAGITTDLIYTLEKATDDQFVFVGVNDTATSTDTISVTPSGTGSKVAYTAELDPHGLAKLASPAMKLIFEKVANDTRHQMTEVLNKLAD